MKLNQLVMAAVALSCGASFAGTEGALSTFYGNLAGSNAPSSTGLNTLVGAQAGREITDGTLNTFVGTFAGILLNGSSNTFIGSQAGFNAISGNDNTFLGASAGLSSTTGSFNTYLGRYAGFQNEVGIQNVAVGYLAGAENVDGSSNVFIGNRAGQASTGSNLLYIDNCFLFDGGGCSLPLLYGEFHNRLLDIDGVVHVTPNRSLGAVKSQLHFSVSGDDVGGWLTSAGENNFFTSSGARYDADAGGWIQRSADGKAVIAGSGAAGFRVLTSIGTAVGNVTVPVSRLHIDYDGAMGVNTAPVAGRAINTSTGAYLSSGGMWINASSRDLKDDIRALSPEAALQALRDLKPVTYRYKAEAGETHAGFIAEDAPALVATADRKGLSAMEVVAVLTKVAQERQSELEEVKSELNDVKSQLQALAAMVQRLRGD